MDKMVIKSLYIILLISSIFSQNASGENETYILHKKTPENNEINEKSNEIKSGITSSKPVPKSDPVSDPVLVPETKPENVRKSE